jgi:predicted  nucleic acid-binding Zn-ribbon protein
MADTTNIEKKSLEAHVELCAERYSALESRLDNVDSKISQLEKIICEVRDMVQTMSEKRNDQLINWAIGAIGTLIAMVGYLVTQYVFK